MRTDDFRGGFLNVHKSVKSFRILEYYFKLTVTNFYVIVLMYI